MATVALVSLSLLMFIAVEQVAAAVLLLRYCRPKQQPVGDFQPSVLVVLPIRGADQCLADCITGLVHQDYDDYRVRIIFDSETDPGWRIADEVLDEFPGAPIELMCLQTVRRSCSLKCSAVYEATADLDDAEVVAFLDSDIVPHATWLRELVAPLADQDVGVAHGNRWYLPTTDQWGSLLRYCWNVVAVGTMHFWGMPWGGTFAVKREVLKGSDIRQRWLRAGCEDVPLVDVVRQLGLKVRFVPSLLMRDRSETTLRACMPFLDRQLLWVRLYYPACWWASNVWQVLIVAAMLAAAACGVYGIMTADWVILGYALAALVVPPVLGLVLLQQLEKTLVPTETTPVSLHPLKLLLAISLTNVAILRVVAVSLWTNSIDWRGITYRIGGPWKIEMVEYQPYESRSRRAEPAGQVSEELDPNLAETATH